MQRQKTQAENLARTHQMTDIRTRIAIAARIAAAALFHDIVVVSELGILHDEASRPGHRHAIAGNARRIDAVEHIDAAHDAFDEMVRRADAHEITRLVLRQ